MKLAGHLYCAAYAADCHIPPIAQCDDIMSNRVFMTLPILPLLHRFYLASKLHDAPLSMVAMHGSLVTTVRRFVMQQSMYHSTKRLLQASSIALLSLPAQSAPALNMQTPAYTQVMAQKTLTIAAVPGDSTFFATDGFQHGFGYDLVRQYADELGVAVHLKGYATDEAALRALKSGQADMALTTASTQLKSQLNLASANLSCGYDSNLTKNGLHPKVSWSFHWFFPVETF